MRERWRGRKLIWEVIPSGISKRPYALTLEPGGAVPSKHVGVVGHDNVGCWHWRAHGAGGTFAGWSAR